VLTAIPPSFSGRVTDREVAIESAFLQT